MKRTLIVGLILLSSIVASCGDDSGGTTEPPPTSTTTTTMAGTTTTATTTTTSALGYSVGDPASIPDVFDGSAGAHGSGCVVEEDTLPDGVWFGFVSEYASGDLTFDLACFFTGQAAIDAATADGAEAFDFYIRNQNAKTYTIALAGDGTAWYLDVASGDVTPIPTAASGWPLGLGYNECPGDFCPVWLYVNGGVATELVEQYLP